MLTVRWMIVMGLGLCGSMWMQKQLLKVRWSRGKNWCWRPLWRREWLLRRRVMWLLLPLKQLGRVLGRGIPPRGLLMVRTCYVWRRLWWQGQRQRRMLWLRRWWQKVKMVDHIFVDKLGISRYVCGICWIIIMGVMGGGWWNGRAVKMVKYGEYKRGVSRWKHRLIGIKMIIFHNSRAGRTL